MTNDEIIGAVQEHCANLSERMYSEGRDWTPADGEFIASLLNQASTPFDPVGLFRFMDEKTGDWRVGYRTKDGREWFHILRQMRNAPGSGLLENLRNT